MGSGSSWRSPLSLASETAASARRISTSIRRLQSTLSSHPGCADTARSRWRMDDYRSPMADAPELPLCGLRTDRLAGLLIAPSAWPQEDHQSPPARHCGDGAYANMLPRLES